MRNVLARPGRMAVGAVIGAASAALFYEGVAWDLGARDVPAVEAAAQSGPEPIPAAPPLGKVVPATTVVLTETLTPSSTPVTTTVVTTTEDTSTTSATTTTPVTTTTTPRPTTTTPRPTTTTRPPPPPTTTTRPCFLFICP
ncbi:hypothetical protein [Actinokineospora sp.]|uniref:hypothetical protein n=1 Tax=Actinokineospora sp. TaxID=1872133 RepID=UPI0040377F0F